MLHIEWSKTVRAIRLSSALLVTFFITWYCEVPEGIWALITCCVVLFEYTTFGGVVAKSSLRFFGTICNSMAALVVVYCFGNNPIVNLIALIIGIFINAYLFLDTTKSYTSMLGCITLTITLVNYHHLSAAILRTFNVLIGEGVCLLTFYFIFPQYARDKVIDIQVNVFSELIHILNNLLSKISSLEEIKMSYRSYEKDFLASITDFNRYISEAAMEVKNTPVVIIEHKKAMRSLKHIYYLINTFFYYMSLEKNRFTPPVIQVLQKMIEYLTMLQSLLQNPTEKKMLLAPIENDPIVSGQKLPILRALLEDIDKEFAELKISCEKISAIRLHRYRKINDIHV